MKQTTNQAVRERLVSNTLGSLRIENMRPSQSLKQGLDGYIAGQKTAADLVGEVMRRYVTVRRG